MLVLFYDIDIVNIIYECACFDRSLFRAVHQLSDTMYEVKVELLSMIIGIAVL
jgi:hypothetical protein